MSRISRVDLYTPDASLDPLDSWVGTDANETKRTKTYYLGNVADYIIEQIESGAGDSDAYRIIRGSVYWLQNLDFGSTKFNYYIGGTYYTAPARPLITLAAADATYGRKDVFVLTTNNELTVLTGTPSANPVEPTIDYNTHIRVTVVDIAAGSTVPTGITSTLVYDENAGTPTEYDATESTSAVRIDLASVTDPDLNATHILGTGIVNNDKITFTYSDLVTLLNFSSLNFRIKLSSATAFDMSVIFYNGTDVISNPGLRVVDGAFGFDNSNVDTYHNINIPIGQLLFTVSSFTHFVITFIPTGASNIATIKIDNVRLLYGMEQIIYPDTYLALKDTFDSGYEGKALYSPVVTEGENGLKLQRTPQFIDLFANGAIFSGNVDWIENLDFESTVFTYYFQGEFRTAPARDLITLSPSDPTYDRIDSFVLTTDNVLIVVEGTPSAVAVAPTLDYDTQLLVTSVTIPAGATIPLGFSESIVYNENTGEPTEFTTTENTSSARIDTASIANPYFGTVNIEGTDVEIGDQITFSYSSLISVSGLSSLNLKILNKTFASNSFMVYFYNGSTLVSSEKLRVEHNRFGYDRFNITSYQNINIPVESIRFTDTEFDRIVFRFMFFTNLSSSRGFYMDSIRLLYGITNLSQKNTYLGLDDTYDSSYVGKRNYAPLVTEQESGLSLQRIILPSDIYGPNGILPGGARVEHLVDFDFRIYGVAYIIDSVVYEGPDNYVQGDRTLADAHPTFSRYDVFVINSDTKAQGTVTLDSGASGSVDSITINGIELLTGAVPFNTDLNTTAIDVANDINSQTTFPNYYARAISGVIYIDAVEKGVIPNGYVVTSTTTTLVTTDVNMSGGIDDTHSVGVLTGYAETNYNKPVPDPATQVEVTNRVTVAGETSPTEVTLTHIYNENLGDPTEWDAVVTPAGLNLAYATSPEDGTLSALMPAIPSAVLSFTTPTPVAFGSESVIYLALKTNSTWTTNQVRLGFQISQSGVIGGTSTIQRYNRNGILNIGFDHTITGTWQTIAIPISIFTIASATFDTFNIWFENTPILGIDHIRFQGGFGGAITIVPEYTLSPISANIFNLLKDGVIVGSINLTPYADQTASEVPISDAGGYYSSSDVEGALQELGVSVLTGIAGFRKRTVINIVDNTAVPPTEVSGDRYILDNTGASHADWDGAAAWDIVEFDGASWVAATPEEGWVAYVDALDVDYRFVDDGSPIWEAATIGGINNIVEDTTPQLGGVLDTNSKQVQWSKGADVASASALPILTDGNYFDVTGVTTITSINTTGKVGTLIKLHFDGILILTHHATDLVLPTGANITTQIGDEAEFIEYAAGDFRCTGYLRADGTPLVGGGGLANIVEDLTPQLGGDLDTNGFAIVAADHGTATSPQVVNVVYGTGSPPAAGTTPEGTLFIQYTA